MLTQRQAPEEIAHFTNYGGKSKDGCDMVLNLSVTLNSILHRHSNLASHLYISMDLPVCWKLPHSGEKFWMNMAAGLDD